MFLNCTSLRTVTIPESVKTVDESAFSGCEALESITFPQQVNFIGKEAFLDCDALKHVTFENKEGWRVRPSKSSLSHVFDVTPEDLNNQETVQEYLIHRYNDYYWYRREII